MSYTTAAHHCITELQFVSADDVLNIVHYQAPSASRPGGWNMVALCTTTGEVFCTCKGFETGHECWHASLVQAAWDAHPARVLAAQYTTDQLVKAGTKAARMCKVYRRRTWRVLPADAVALVACRAEWFRRQGVRVALPVEAA